jgi:hypothetical protein
MPPDKFMILFEKMNAIKAQIKTIKNQQEQLKRRKANLKIQQAQQQALDLSKQKF